MSVRLQVVPQVVPEGLLPAMSADKCYNGVVDTDKTKTSIDCPTGASRCPSLATGLKCTVGRGENEYFSLLSICTNCLAAIGQQPACGRWDLADFDAIAADLCVKGAQCIAGVCQPSSKAFASSTQPAATVYTTRVVWHVCLFCACPLHAFAWTPIQQWS